MAKVAYNPWGRAVAPVNTDSSAVRAIKSGDVGLGGLQTVLGKAPPTISPDVSILGQMGAQSAGVAQRLIDSGTISDPSNPANGYFSGLTADQMQQYLSQSAGGAPFMSPTVPAGVQRFTPGATAPGAYHSVAGNTAAVSNGLARPNASTLPADTSQQAGRTANTAVTNALTRGANPLETAADPNTDTADMLSQADYLRNVAAGRYSTAAQSQLAQGIEAAKAGQASLAAGVRGSQAAAARRGASEAALDITNQGRGQMAAQQAADQLSARAQLQDMNQGISTGLGNRQDLIANGVANDLAAQRTNQANEQDIIRSTLANLATRNDMTAEQKQQELLRVQNQLQAQRLAATYALRAQQMGANQQLGMLGTDVGNTSAAGGVSDRVDMARFQDATQRSAATIGAIGAGAGMAIRGLSGNGNSSSAPSYNQTPPSPGNY